MIEGGEYEKHTTVQTKQKIKTPRHTNKQTNKHKRLKTKLKTTKTT